MLGRIWLVAAIALVVTATAAAVVAMLPNRFDASAVVQIDPRRKSISNLEGVISDLNPNNATVDSEVEVIRSRAIALKVIDILGLRSDPEFGGTSTSAASADGQSATPAGANNGTGADHDAIGRLLGASTPGVAEPERDQVAAAFANKLKVQRVRVTLLIEIKFSSSDPVKAAKIANTIAEVYLNEQIEEKKRASGFASELLEEKLETLKVKVADAEHRVEKFKAENGIFDAEGGTILSETQLGQQMQQTMAARNATAHCKSQV